MNIKDFIKKRPYLTWDIKDPENISDQSIVEKTLNYGDFDDFKAIIKIFGPKKTKSLFLKGEKSKRSNFDPKVANYFKLYFKYHA
ncbi:MAG: hypothetical protein PHW75_02580 [Patescibacteria group bacterium]|nr:hypothetical protein [Patescibacteria group bacterium]